MHVKKVIVGPQDKPLRFRSLIKRKKARELLLFLTVMFFTFAMFGWLAETWGFVIKYGLWRDRGFLVLPLCPIYGFGVVLVYLILDCPQGNRWRRLKRAIRGKRQGKASNFFAWAITVALYYLAATLLVNGLELVAGFVFDKFFHVRLWDYSGFAYNIGGYICLKFFFLWGLLLTPAMAIALPYVRMVIRGYGKKFISRAVVFMFYLTLIDLSFNLCYNMVTGNNLILFEQYYTRSLFDLLGIPV